MLLVIFSRRCGSEMVQLGLFQSAVSVMRFGLKSEKRLIASVQNKSETHERLKRTLFIRTKHNTPILHFMKTTQLSQKQISLCVYICV